MDQAERASPHVAVDGTLLRRHRHLRGLSQGGLGDLAGVSPTLISKIENGRRLHIQPETYAKLCDALGVTDRTELMATPPAPPTP